MRAFLLPEYIIFLSGLRFFLTFYMRNLVYLHGVFIAPLSRFWKFWERSLYQSIQRQQFLRATTPCFNAFSSFQLLLSFCFALIYGRRPVALFAACKPTIHLDFPKGFVVSLLRHVSLKNQETIWLSIRASSWPKASRLIPLDFSTTQLLWSSRTKHKLCFLSVLFLVKAKSKSMTTSRANSASIVDLISCQSTELCWVPWQNCRRR